MIGTPDRADTVIPKRSGDGNLHKRTITLWHCDLNLKNQNVLSLCYPKSYLHLAPNMDYISPTSKHIVPAVDDMDIMPSIKILLIHNFCY